MRVPDFRTAQFVVCNENPFRLTPPLAQASSRAHTKGDNTNERFSENEPPIQHNYPDPSFSDIFAAFQEAFVQRKAQGLAFLELTNSELMLIKKSFLVTVFACLASFAVGTICWLILNIAVGTILHNMGVHYVVVPLVLLALNSITAFGLFKLAQNAYNYLSFNRLIQTWRRVFK